MTIGKFCIGAGSLKYRIGPHWIPEALWIPDGLHLWWGDRGVHLYWRKSVHSPRVEFERLPEDSEHG